MVIALLDRGQTEGGPREVVSGPKGSATLPNRDQIVLRGGPALVQPRPNTYFIHNSYNK